MDLSDASAIVLPVWAIGPDLTLEHAASHQALLLEAMPILQNDPRLDLSDVTAIDSSGVQLLLSLRRTLMQTGQTLQLFEPSPVVIEAIERLGLAPHLPIAADAPLR